VREFAQWRAVPADERSPAPAWWWQPAFEVVAQQEEMPPLCSIRLELPLSSTYADGAAVLIATLADQTSLTWPDEFPRKSERDSGFRITERSGLGELHGICARLGCANRVSHFRRRQR
jgi:hypothetical protein